LDEPETNRLAHAFGVPVLIDANVRDGSLRQAVLERDIPMLLYEAGEALRFDEQAIRAGVRGVLSTMEALEMLPGADGHLHAEPFVARSSHWIRAPESGILRSRARLGALVNPGQRLGAIADPLGAEERFVLAEKSGIVIGRTELPLVNEGDALFHIATFERPDEVLASVEDFQEEFDDLA
jgi:predicted deacylase